MGAPSRPGMPETRGSKGNASARTRIGGALGIPPPDGRERRSGVLGQLSGTPETVPARGALLAVGPLRHHEMMPQQDAIERPGGGDQLGAILGEDHALDQRVDRRIPDADE